VGLIHMLCRAQDANTLVDIKHRFTDDD